jgi:hypothetical protein
MCKTLCVAVLLLSTFVLAQGASPTIVAKAKLINQTAQIPTTNDLHPRLIGAVPPVGLCNHHHARSQQPIVLVLQRLLGRLFWSANRIYLLTQQANHRWQFFQLLNYQLGGPSLVLEVKAGKAIKYSVTQDSPNNSAYSLYYTLEQLE